MKMEIAKISAAISTSIAWSVLACYDLPINQSLLAFKVAIACTAIVVAINIYEIRKP
jgi:hypothetical protein